MMDLVHSHNLPRLLDLQKERKWNQKEGMQVSDRVGKRVGILGYGSIGRQGEFAHFFRRNLPSEELSPGNREPRHSPASSHYARTFGSRNRYLNIPKIMPSYTPPTPEIDQIEAKRTREPAFGVAQCRSCRSMNPSKRLACNPRNPSPTPPWLPHQSHVPGKRMSCLLRKPSNATPAIRRPSSFFIASRMELRGDDTLTTTCSRSRGKGNGHGRHRLHGLTPQNSRVQERQRLHCAWHR